MTIKNDVKPSDIRSQYLCFLQYVSVRMDMFFAYFRGLIENEMVYLLPLLRLWLTTNE
jgi:hypothetical protein